MKKRLVALTLVAAMALGMTACGSKSNNKTTTNDNSDTAVSAGVDWTGYDELVDSIRTEADLAKRAEMMHQAEDMLMDTWCVIPLYYYNDQYMLKDYVTDVYSTVEGMKYFYNAKNTKNAGKLNIFMASEPDHIDPALNSTVDGGCLAVNSFEGLMRYNTLRASLSLHVQRAMRFLRMVSHTHSQCVTVLSGQMVMSLLQRISSGLGREQQILRQLQITATFAQYSQDMMIQRVLLLMM